jgi:hypothetical protein
VAKKQKAPPLDLGVDPSSGRTIVGVRLDVRGAGGGLGHFLDIDPVRISQGDRVKVLIDAVCIDVGHPLADLEDPDESGVYEKAILNAETAIIVEGQVYEKAISSFRERADVAAEKAAGIHRLDLLGADHAAGKHDVLVEGCEECDRERELEADEQGGEA